MLDGDPDLRAARAAFGAWDKRNDLLLDRAFKKDGWMDTTPKNDYLFAMGLTYPFGVDMTDEVTLDGLRKDRDEKVRRLEHVLATLDAYEPPQDHATVPPTGSAGAREQGTDSVFLIHDRNDHVREQVENVIRRTTPSTPLVLSDQANGGSTLIEKLEHHLNQRRVAFAVVIMTADDVGRLADAREEKPRARQNVVLELGFAMAALGRNRVTILNEDGVDLPSDISGVVYHSLNNEAWKVALVGELNRAGIEADANELL